MIPKSTSFPEGSPSHHSTSPSRLQGPTKSEKNQILTCGSDGHSIQEFLEVPPKNNLLDKYYRNRKLHQLKAPPSLSQLFHWSRLTISHTKDHFVSALAEANGYPPNQTVELVEILLELMKSKLASGEDVLISGFGKLCVKHKRERRGRNPATDNCMMLRPRRVVMFKCSGQLRDRING